MTVRSSIIDETWSFLWYS